MISGIYQKIATCSSSVKIGSFKVRRKGRRPAEIKNVTWLKVPYAQKDVAKLLGARWSSEAKQWYIPEYMNKKPFKLWL